MITKSKNLWKIVWATGVWALAMFPLSLAQTSSSKTMNVVPYFVRLQSVTYKSDGSIVRRGSELFIGLRRDGAYLIGDQDRTPTSQHRYRMLRFANGNRVEIRDDDQVQSSRFVPNTDPSIWIRQTASTCRSTAIKDEQLLGIEMMGGYRAAKIAVGTTTYWYALDHGCARIHERIDFGSNGFTERTLISLSDREPPAELFTAPSGFREVPPSAFQVQLKGTRPDLLARDDADYLAHRPI